MNIQYQRNLKSSYMVVTEPGQPLNMDGQLAEKMMQSQQIPGLLQWVTMEHEGDMTFWYQITGLQSLSDWLRHHPLDYVLFGHLLGGLLALQEELPRFYLKSEHLLLGSEQIFLDTSGERVAFCYEPLWQKEPQEALRELMEHLLPLIDHDDKDAVRLGYGLYEKCQEPNADIWRYVMEEAGGRTPSLQSGAEKLRTAAEKEPECALSTPEAAVQSKSAPLKKETPAKTSSIKEALAKTAPIKEALVKPATEKAAGEASVPAAFLKDASSKNAESLQKKMLEKLPSVSALAWLEGLRKKKRVETAETVYLFEPESDHVESSHPTVFLGTAETAEGRLLYQGAGAEQSFVIEGDSFLVGGRNEKADGKLSASGVSRNHARITREADDYYIEDLNSRNGTYLNGKLLSYKEKYQVKPGDHVRFAREEYVFY